MSADPWHVELDFVAENGDALYERILGLLYGEAQNVVSSLHNCAELGCKDEPE